MDIQRIDAAVEAYGGILDKGDADRLAFFKGLMAVQNRHAEAAAERNAYALADPAAAEGWYWNQKPFFLMAPVPIDADAFASALEDCSRYLADHAGLPAKTAEALRSFDMKELIEKTDLGLAGSDPAAYIDAACETARAGADEQSAPVDALALALAFALRPLLEPAARTAMDQVDLKQVNENHNRPQACPACGGLPAAAAVGETPSGAANGKMLYCALCGTTWEFERIRCARCGTQNQGKLHYFHVEGDDAHRLYLCDACGEYTRTVFKSDLRAPFAFEVEDVIMAKLDMVAHDPRFAANKG